MTFDVLALDILILAAGSASRFGGCKLLADWQEQPLIAASITAARALKPEKTIIVAGAFYSQLKEAQLNLNDVELLEFRDYNVFLYIHRTLHKHQLENAFQL